jgi:hypothetical protein
MRREGRLGEGRSRGFRQTAFFVNPEILIGLQDQKCQRQFLPGRSKIEIFAENGFRILCEKPERLSMQNSRMLNKLPGVIHTVRNILARALPPKSYSFVQFYWTRLSFYLRGLATFGFVKPTLVVRGFGGGDGVSDLVKQLRSVNPLAPTEMCRVMTKYGSDKGYPCSKYGSDKGYPLHNYTTMYSVLFKECLDQPLRIFELGIGTNNLQLPSTMGVDRRPGPSLRGWRELFPNALVYGADIDRARLFQEDRIKTLYCDQLDQASIRELWSQPELQGGMDIIIEDGLHTYDANVSFLEGSLEHLRPGGIYVIEDIAQEAVDRWYDRLETIYSKRYKTYDFAFVVLPNSFNNLYNDLLVIRRDMSQ